MTRRKMPAGKNRTRIIKLVGQEYDRIERELAEQLKLFPTEQARAIVAQNVLRDCMTALFAKMTPYSPGLAVDMSRRAASYALSTLSIEDLEFGVADHLDGFAEFHLQRTAQGQVIETGWKMNDGTERPNFPKGDS